MQKRILVIDNYDSFTYNLVHYLEALNAKVTVMRNDKIDETPMNAFQKIVLSPGSGLPSDAGQLNDFIKKYASTKSLLGICLGQQAIAEVFGGKLISLPKVRHGEAHNICHLDNDPIYKSIPEIFQAGLYHSWHTVDLPKELIPTAKTNEGIIMSLKHKTYNIKAIQYHPESILTPYGKQILMNWLYANDD